MSDQPTENSEAPAETSGAEENASATLSIEDLASSFVEKVESQTEESDPEAAEVTETEAVEAGEDEESEVLSQSSEEDSDEELEEESDENQPKGLSKALKQINRLTARAKGAEEEVAALRDQIQSLKSQPPEQTAQKSAKPALDEIKSVDELNALRAEAIAAKKFAIQNLGKDYVEIDGKEYSDDDIRSILMQAEDYLTEKIPQRASFLQEKQAWLQDTVSTFPWVAKGEGPEYELFLQVRDGPQYKSILDGLPNGDFVAGVLVEGINSVKARQEQSQKPKAKAKAKTPPPATGDAVAPPAENKEARQSKKKNAILNKAGNLSESDFAQILNL